MKRLLDFTAAAFGLVALWPVMAVAALLIRRDSPGPAIFAQPRIGRDGRPFTCYKLRTMRRDTAHVPTHMAAASAVTPLGQKLRRWKLDELPQLWNVLTGDMSLVGPRPCLPTQHELIEARRLRGVLVARPGITGLAQVQNIDMSEPQRLADVDAMYVATQSLPGDLRLLLATLTGGGVGVDQIRQANR